MPGYHASWNSAYQTIENDYSGTNNIVLDKSRTGSADQDGEK